MIRMVVFGAICELEDNDFVGITRDHFTLTRPEVEAEIEAARLRNRGRHPRSGFYYVGLDEMVGLPWYARPRRRTKRISLRFTEFADLSDGERVTVRSDRGFGWRWKRKRLGPWHGVTRESLAHSVSDYIVQVEADRPCSPEWVVERLQRLYGIAVDPASVEAALRIPRRVELGPRLLQELPR